MYKKEPFAKAFSFGVFHNSKGSMYDKIKSIRGDSMFEHIKKEAMGTANYGWLKPRYHFSFAQYYDMNRVELGTLRVLNDDIIMPGGGFDTHPHNNMEIITYVIDGVLTHKDSMGNNRLVGRGSVQYMSAGTGVYHSEYNHGETPLRLIQIWIKPNERGLDPMYGDQLFFKENRHNKLLNIVSGREKGGMIFINQDVNIFASELDDGEAMSFDIEDYRYLYFVNLEGDTFVNDALLSFGDAVKTDKSITIKAVKDTHFLLLQIK